MAREDINDLRAFVNVARESSFTRAAAQMDVTPSALSHAIRNLETRIGVKLLVSTTRNVSTTEAGARLFSSVAPRFDNIDAELSAIGEFREKPAGLIRITSAEHAANSVLWPKLSEGLKDYPDIKVEIAVDYTLTDIVSQRFDAGVRIGDQVAKDMFAVRISPDQRMAVVGSPEYFLSHTLPTHPRDLSNHDCINLRLPTYGSLLQWEFAKGNHSIKARVSGRWTFNSSSPMLRAALAGQGLGYVPEGMAQEHIENGQLVRVLDEWCQPYPGYFLYYPSPRESSRALSVVVEALRHRD